MDFLTPSDRSARMSLIRSKNSKAETAAFKYLKANGIYFQKHYTRAPGKPDIALPRKKKAVFIDSEFWHGKTLDKLAKERPTNDYWIIKIKRNIERDKENRNALQAKGWQILIVWENDINRMRTRSSTLKLIMEFLLNDRE